MMKRFSGYVQSVEGQLKILLQRVARTGIIEQMPRNSRDLLKFECQQFVRSILNRFQNHYSQLGQEYQGKLQLQYQCWWHVSRGMGSERTFIVRGTRQHSAAADI